MIEIYSSPRCNFCWAAKSLLDEKGIIYTEIDITKNPEERAAMITRAQGAHTVPQIFLGDLHIGGCDDLYALEAAGKLDPLLTHE